MTKGNHPIGPGASLLRPLVAAGLLLLLAACNDGGERAYQAASSRLDDARERVERLERHLSDHGRNLEAAQRRVELARGALIDARHDLAVAENRLGEAATDEVLFRVIQQRLLDDRALRAAAISIRVEDGRVTLYGRVPDEKLFVRAAEVAGRAPGVRSIDNRIELRPAPLDA